MRKKKGKIEKKGKRRKEIEKMVVVTVGGACETVPILSSIYSISSLVMVG